MPKTIYDEAISLINEPPQPVEVEMRRLTAREIAQRRWKMERTRQ